MGEKAVLAVFYGTARPEDRTGPMETLGRTLEEAFPRYRFERAFLSRRIREKLEERTGVRAESPAQAAQRLLGEGCDELLVQPCLTAPGEAYEALLEELRPFPARVGAPLLSTPEDYRETAAALAEILPKTEAGKGTILVGHGGGAGAERALQGLEESFRALGREDVAIGSLKRGPEELFARLEGERIGEILLLPLLMTAGEHARRDLFGAGEGSWRSRLERRGYRTVCMEKGLGEYPGIGALLIRHAREAESG